MSSATSHSDVQFEKLKLAIRRKRALKKSNFEYACVILYLYIFSINCCKYMVECLNKYFALVKLEIITSTGINVSQSYSSLYVSMRNTKLSQIVTF